MWNWLTLLIALLALPAYAHKPSDSYLTINITNDVITGQWDIALRDLDYALGLDDNADNQITWGELKHHQATVVAYSLARLALNTDANLCTTQLSDYLVDQHSDGYYAVLRFSAMCPIKPEQLTVDYRLFFDLDPTHRGLLNVNQDSEQQTAIFSPEQPRQQILLNESNAWLSFKQFVEEGVWHIWIGYDHILFLISLLLPSVVFRNGRQWLPVIAVKSAFLEVAKVVTAFTLAHSITLSLAALGWLDLPSRWVESAIAASVLLAALNNISPYVTQKLWLAAFAFGLIHGLGFASVLNDLGVNGKYLLVNLVGFNVGVELGQFVIVAIFFPFAYLARHSWYYQRLTLNFGSLIIAVIASFWLLDRSMALGWSESLARFNAFSGSVSEYLPFFNT